MKKKNKTGKKRGRPRKNTATEAPSAPTEASEAATSGSASAREQKPLPSYENAQVIEVVSDLGEWKRCRMSDGTTKDVPSTLF